MSLLVVSDSDPLREQIRDYLEDAEVGTITYVESAQEARKALGLRSDGGPPDDSWNGIIYDLKQKDRAGLQVCEDYARASVTSPVPILAVVRRINAGFLTKAFGVGVTDCIQTPLSDLVLRKRVKNYLDCFGQ